MPSRNVGMGDVAMECICYAAAGEQRGGHSGGVWHGAGSIDTSERSENAGLD